MATITTTRNNLLTLYSYQQYSILSIISLKTVFSFGFLSLCLHHYISSVLQISRGIRGHLKIATVRIAFGMVVWSSPRFANKWNKGRSFSRLQHFFVACQWAMNNCSRIGVWHGWVTDCIDSRVSTWSLLGTARAGAHPPDGRRRALYRASHGVDVILIIYMLHLYTVPASSPVQCLGQQLLCFNECSAFWNVFL